MTYKGGRRQVGAVGQALVKAQRRRSEQTIAAISRIRAASTVR